MYLLLFSLLITSTFTFSFGQAALVNHTKAGHAVNVTATLDCSATPTGTAANFVGVIVAEQLMSSVVGTMTSTPSCGGIGWQHLTDSPDGGNSHVGIWYCGSLSGNLSSFSITYSGGMYPWIAPICMSNTNSPSPKDQGPANAGCAAPCATGPLTPTQTNEFVITGGADDETTQVAIPMVTDNNSVCTYVTTDYTNTIPSTNSGGMAGYGLCPTKSATNPSWVGFVSGAVTAATFESAPLVGSSISSGTVKTQ